MTTRQLLVVGLAAVCLALAPLANAEQVAQGTAEIAGLVWLDRNVDGLRQASEPAVARIQVRVQGVKTIASTVADDLGYYRFAWKGEEAQNPAALTFTADYVDGEIPYRGCVATRWVSPGTSYAVSLRLIPVESFVGRESPPFDWPVPDGHFFKGHFFMQESWPLTGCDGGFTIGNTEGIGFWDMWQGLGPQVAGYPVSHRFLWAGRVTQVFQNVVFQWLPESRQVLVREVAAVMGDRQFPHKALEPGPSLGPPEAWVKVLDPTPIYGPDNQVLRVAEPHEWYWVVLEQDEWVLAVGEHDPPDQLVWIKLASTVKGLIL